MKRLEALILFLSLIMSVSVLAQRERNYIYLFGCKKSVVGDDGSLQSRALTRHFLIQIHWSAINL